MTERLQKESWSSHWGAILAVAGSAIGLGNMLRFPVQAADNGGGAFMIPYFISLLLIGIPMMWIEWSIGRYGGRYGHTTGPSILHQLWRNRFSKYVGVISVFAPLVIFIFYIYIESWLLGYSFYALSGTLTNISDKESMAAFLSGYQGIETNAYFHNIAPAYFFFLVTFFINFFIIFQGVTKGIERVCRITLPLLFIVGIILMIRVVTLPYPDVDRPDWSIFNGFGYLWNPDFSSLLNAKTWLAAAGQIFFTLSLGMGIILTYASYLKEKDDIVLSGLTASATNEFAEIVLGGSIVIPLAFAFLGPEGMQGIASRGAFDLGFVTMPFIFTNISLGAFFCFLWFFLLFIAGITSSIALIEPTVAFVRDNFQVARKKATIIIGIITFLLCQPVIFFLSRGVLNELDFWAGTFCLVLLGTIEAILFAWVLGIDKSWDEIHQGAKIKIPIVYKWIMRWITPTMLLVVLGAWIVQEGWPTIIMTQVREEDIPYVLCTRIGLIALFLILAFLVHIWHKKYSFSSFR